ncbi:MAG: glycosyltransferase [Candidatus Omnitrophota bacterium]
MRAIFLVRDNPSPPVNGYKKRNYYLVDYLKKGTGPLRGSVSNDVALVNGELKKNIIQKVIIFISSLLSLVPFSVKIRTDNKVRQEIRQRCKENPVDLIICDGIHRSLNIPFDVTGVKVLYEHNIEATIAGRYARLERNIFKKIFAYMEYLKFKLLQKKMWGKFNYCIACSDVDKKAIEAVVGEERVITVNNGVDLQYFSPGSYPVEANTLVYTGQIGWYPNEDGLVYFSEQILPVVKKIVPEVKLWIVGDRPSARIKSLAQRDNNILVTGFVDDVREFMGKASVYIVPLRIGSGTRLKILEAMSMRKAIVTTSVGCEGLEVKDAEHLLIRDNPKDFAQAVIELLQDEGLRLKLGENGRRLVEEKYDWKVVFKSLGTVLGQSEKCP